MVREYTGYNTGILIHSPPNTKISHLNALNMDAEPFFCQVIREQSEAGLWATECVEELGAGLYVRAEWGGGCDIRLIVDNQR